MLIEGSCHCGAVSFSVESNYPVPYQKCYCSICRKTQGGSGALINLAGDASTLKVKGQDSIQVYQAMLEKDGKKVQSPHERHFCEKCGSHLWAFNAKWPDLVHPVASAVDTDLPKPPEFVHMMYASKATWVDVKDKGDVFFPQYPNESIRNWHKRLDLDCG